MKTGIVFYIHHQMWDVNILDGDRSLSYSGRDCSMESDFGKNWTSLFFESRHGRALIILKSILVISMLGSVNVNLIRYRENLSFLWKSMSGVINPLTFREVVFYNLLERGLIDCKISGVKVFNVNDFGLISQGNLF